jgi:hypothetical protein
LDHARGDIKSRRTLDGVKGGDASARPGTYVDEAAALGERCEDQVDPLCDRPQSAVHGGSDFGIFTVDDAGDFERGLAIEMGGGGVCFLGAEAAEFYAACFAIRSFAFQAFFPKASITASWNAGRICLIAWFWQSGQVRLVSRVIESWRSGSIHRDVPV